MYGSSSSVVTMATNDAYNSRVGRLKHRFQDDDDVMNGQGNQSRRKSDTKRSRQDENNPGGRVPRNGNSNSAKDNIDPSTVINDPQFFETTNHVQRFQFTRAIFAQMEEQNMKEKEQQQRRRRVGSPARVGVGNRFASVDINIPPSEPFDQQQYKAQHQKGKPAMSSTKTRSTSVENLSHTRSREDHSDFARKEFAKSEMDLHRAVETARPSPKSLILQFEQGKPTPVEVEDEVQPTDASQVASPDVHPGSPTKPAVKPASVLSPTSTVPSKSIPGGDFFTPAAYHKPSFLPPSKAEPKSSSPRESKPSDSEEPAGLEQWKQKRAVARKLSQEESPTSAQPSYTQKDAKASSSETTRSSSAGPTALLASSSTSAIEMSSGDGTSVTRSNSGSNLGSEKRSSRIDSVSPNRRYGERFKSDPSNSSIRDYNSRYANIRKDLEEDNDYQEAVQRWRNKLRRRHSKDRNGDQAEETKEEKSSTSAIQRPASLFNNSVEEEVSSLRASKYSTGVLLNKRRSRAEEEATKESLEENLKQADMYWKNSHGEGLDNRRGLTDSTYSSGSGEEMAKSDGNIDLEMISPADGSYNKHIDWLSAVAAEAKAANGGSSFSSGTFLPRTDTLEKALSDSVGKSNSQVDDLPPLPSFPSKEDSDTDMSPVKNEPSSPIDRAMREEEETEIRFDTEIEPDYVEITREVTSNDFYEPRKQPPPFPGDKG